MPRPTRQELAQVAQAMSLIADEAARLPESAVRALIPVLAQARVELSQGLAMWLRDVPNGEERFTAQRYRVALLTLETALSVVEERVTEGTARVLRDQLPAATAMASRHLVEQVAIFGPVFGQAIDPPSIERAALVAEGRKMLVPRFENSAARYSGQVRKDITQQLAIGVVKGESFDEMTDRLQRLGGPRGLVYTRGRAGVPGARAEQISEGLFRRYRYWGERLVRTEAMNAYNVMHETALEEAEEDDPGYMQRWDASADRRVCAICRSLDGATAKLGGSFGMGITRPPAHPNCRCVLTPWRKEWQQEKFSTAA